MSDEKSTPKAIKIELSSAHVQAFLRLKWTRRMLALIALVMLSLAAMWFGNIWAYADVIARLPEDATMQANQIPAQQIKDYLVQSALVALIGLMSYILLIAGTDSSNGNWGNDLKIDISVFVTLVSAFIICFVIAVHWTRNEFALKINATPDVAWYNWSILLAVAAGIIGGFALNWAYQAISNGHAVKSTEESKKE